MSTDTEHTMPKTVDDAETSTDRGESSSAADAVAGQLDQPKKDIAAQTDRQEANGYAYSGACVLPINLTEIEDKDKEIHQVAMCMMGLDKRTGKLTMLGGRPEKTDKNPIYTACRELWEETIGAVCPEGHETIYKDVQQLYDDGEIVEIVYSETKLPYYIYLVPCQLSYAMMGEFQDRLHEYEKSGKVKALEKFHEFTVDEKSKIAWVPCGPASQDKKQTSWFARKLLEEIMTHFQNKVPFHESAKSKEPKDAETKETETKAKKDQNDEKTEKKAEKQGV